MNFQKIKFFFFVFSQCFEVIQKVWADSASPPLLSSNIQEPRYFHSKQHHNCPVQLAIDTGKLCKCQSKLEKSPSEIKMFSMGNGDSNGKSRIKVRLIFIEEDCEMILSIAQSNRSLCNRKEQRELLQHYMTYDIDDL